MRNKIRATIPCCWHCWHMGGRGEKQKWCDAHHGELLDTNYMSEIPIWCPLLPRWINIVAPPDEGDHMLRLYSEEVYFAQVKVQQGVIYELGYLGWAKSPATHWQEIDMVPPPQKEEE